MGPTECTVSCLIQMLALYLKGFWNRRIRPQKGKRSAKSGGRKISRVGVNHAGINHAAPPTTLYLALRRLVTASVCPATAQPLERTPAIRGQARASLKSCHNPAHRNPGAGGSLCHECLAKVPGQCSPPFTRQVKGQNCQLAILLDILSYRIRLNASRNPPSSCPSPRQLALASWHLLLPHPQADADGEKGRLNYPQREFEGPLSQPHPLADAATLGCQLAKASWWGERQSEGVFC